MKRIESFSEFWPFYLQQHQSIWNRRLHLLGMLCAVSCLLLAWFSNGYWLVCLPVVGYGFAWVGHFFIESNRPATFQYPLWSLRADFKMCGLMLLGQLKDTD